MSTVQRLGLFARISDALWRYPKHVFWILALPPFLWFATIYAAALIALGYQSLFQAETAAAGGYGVSFTNYLDLLAPKNMTVLARSVVMATTVTLAAAIISFPLAYYVARYSHGKWKTLFYFGIMIPLFTGYLVKLQSWAVIFSSDRLLGEAFSILPIDFTQTTSHWGTFLILLHIALPFMILPVMMTLGRLPRAMLDASADLGAHPVQTFRFTILPLAAPGLVIGSIFTFSLTFGDYIVPRILEHYGPLLGQSVSQLAIEQGGASLAAACTIVPLIVLLFLVWIAKKAGVFDAP